MVVRPVNSSAISFVALTLAVVALAVAAAGVALFPAPQGVAGVPGAAGPTGPMGDTGAQGPTGADGADGLPGTDGAQGPGGADGVACWDLNGNGVGDLPAEDINGDSVVDVLDCTGAVGPQGPPGPGTIMSGNTSSGFMTVGTACTSYMSVAIDVPGPGTVVVTSTAQMTFNHVAGTDDNMRFMIGTSASDCSSDPSMVIYHLDGAAPTQLTIFGAGVQEAFAVTAGTHTYHLNAFMFSGGDANDRFVRASIVSVFYPA